MLPAHHGEVAQFAWWQRPDGSRVMRAISRPTQEWWAIARARQGANTPVPLERYAPASLKRSVGPRPAQDGVGPAAVETPVARAPLEHRIPKARHQNCHD